MISTLVVMSLGMQATMSDIPKADLPKGKTECVVCTSLGHDHGPERPVAGVVFEGKRYYFCKPGEVDQFKRDPEGFLPPVLPRPMPGFDLLDRNGTRWNAEAFRNKVVLIDFWATWCAPCKKLQPELEALAKRQSGLTLLSVSIDEKAEVLDGFLAQNRFENPVLHDNKHTWAGWRVRSVPALFLVKNGQVVSRWVGIPKEGELDAAVKTALASR